MRRDVITDADRAVLSLKTQRRKLTAERKRVRAPGCRSRTHITVLMQHRQVGWLRADGNSVACS